MNVNVEVAGYRMLTGGVWRGPFNGYLYSMAGGIRSQAFKRCLFSVI